MYALKDITNVVYQVHMYLPFKYTHQGVDNPDSYDRNVDGITYPGTIDGKYWDISTVKEALKDVREFSLHYNVHIYVGEYSVTRWSPGAENWLNDVLTVFEDYDWDYSYHAWTRTGPGSPYTGFSLDHSSEENPSTTSSGTRVDTNLRKETVLSYFEKNTFFTDEYCGNGVCGKNENIEICSSDCKESSNQETNPLNTTLMIIIPSAVVLLLLVFALFNIVIAVIVTVFCVIKKKKQKDQELTSF